jgi:hypothetical protein
MKTRFVRAALAALVCMAVAVPACNRGKPGAADYFPLKQGMTWTFRFGSSSGAIGNLVTTNLAPRKVFGLIAVGQRNSGAAKSFTEYYTAEPGGIRYIARETPEGLKSHLQDHAYVIKYPIKVGTTWNEVDRTMGGTVFSARTMIESASDTVTVPAGTFEGCIRVRETGVASPVKSVAALQPAATEGPEIAVEDYYWLAPGVGVIKATHRETVGKGVLARSIGLELDLMRFEH